MLVKQILFEREREVRVDLTSLNAHDFTSQWQELNTKLELDPGAKLINFDLFYDRKGEVQKLSYELVERNKDGFLYDYIDYDLQKSKVKVNRHQLDAPWMRYDETIAARYFFERLNETELTLLHPNNDDPIRHLQLNEDGTRVVYAMKDIKKYRIDRNQLHEILDSQLPIEGYWLLVCGMSEKAGPDFVSSCEDRIDYFLDARMGEGT
ncbi:hypothetical protein [Paenibacillus roseipurpureus]|uniref:Uncharacterized protein n=1 Tax=Paenibacillus roseopurpureus TaxID=2918901 RepID=A0AA96LQV4_9BACL|nr:hypothetical protein [Paenibacillus sp. MBLB1832]WNR44158.1 hypothetical protein MJB10_24175 [Paenibacillus sp. MBLB1832]